MARIATLSGSYGNAEARIVILNPELADNLVGLVKSDQSGTIAIEHSIDGTNWDFAETPVAIVGGTGQKLGPFSVVSPYVRVTYTNGATPATVRCSIRLSSAGPRA